MGAESTHTREIAPSAKEYTVMDKGPSVHTGTNQILRLSQSVPFTAKNCISIQSVYSFESNLQRISQLTFTFSQSKVKLSTKPYGDEVSGYVSTALIDTYSGSIAIKKPQNILEKKLQKILSKPKQYNVRPDLINPAITPKIITDNDSKSVYILMAPRDFREVDGPYYTDAMLQEMLVTTYASFKAYAQGFHKAYPGKKVVLHTSYGGIAYCSKSCRN
jgi:hypothetical protein